jgi:general stress protein YciG
VADAVGRTLLRCFAAVRWFHFLAWKWSGEQQKERQRVRLTYKEAGERGRALPRREVGAGGGFGHDRERWLEVGGKGADMWAQRVSRCEREGKSGSGSFQR